MVILSVYQINHRAPKDQTTLCLGVPYDGLAWSISGQLTTIQLGFLTRSHQPVGPLACPARFERAPWALDEIIPRAQSLLLVESILPQALLKVTLKKIPTLELVLCTTRHIVNTLYRTHTLQF